MRSRGINVEFVHGSGSVEGNDLKYICYSADHDTYFHSSYKELLGVLADRIEMRPADVQTKVRKLEKALFFKQNLINGVLWSTQTVAAFNQQRSTYHLVDLFFPKQGDFFLGRLALVFSIF